MSDDVQSQTRHVTYLANKVLQLDTELADLRQQLAEARAGSGSLRAHNETLVRDLREMGREVVRLSSQLAGATQENERLLDGNAAMLGRNIDLSNELATLRERFAERDEELKRLREAASWKPSAADHIVTPMIAGWVVSFWCDGERDWHGKAVWNHHHAADSVVKTEGDCLAQCMTRLANHIERHCRRQEFAALQPKEPTSE